MWNEFTGAQTRLLFEVYKAWVREVIESYSRWKSGATVKRSTQTLPGPPPRAETFVCKHCKRPVSVVAPGARLRSHCPHCLWSLHIEAHPASPRRRCGGTMEPVGVSLRTGGVWSIVHRCRRCQATFVHSAAVDDDGAALLMISLRADSCATEREGTLGRQRR